MYRISLETLCQSIFSYKHCLWHTDEGLLEIIKICMSAKEMDYKALMIFEAKILAYVDEDSAETFIESCLFPAIYETKYINTTERILKDMQK